MKDKNSPLSKHKIAQLILKEKLKDPSLSCRRAAKLLYDKYRLTLSKTAIHSLLVRHNLRESQGRKKEVTRYQKLLYKYCGLFFLKAADEILGLSATLAASLEPVPGMDPDPAELKAFLENLIFSSYFKDLLPEGAMAAHRRLVSRLSGLSLSANAQSRLNKFTSSLNRNTSLFEHAEEINACFEPVITLKLFAADNSVLYADPGLNQCADSPNVPDLYFANKFSTNRRIRSAVIGQGCISLLYNDSPFGASSSFIQSLRILNKGIRRIEALDPQNNPVCSFDLEPRTNAGFTMGFNPPTLKKTLNVVSRVKRERTSFPLLSGTFYLYDFDALLGQTEPTNNLTLRIVLIQKVTAASSYWGIITNLSRTAFTARDVAQKYFFLWNSPLEMYRLHLKLREEYAHAPDDTKRRFFPQTTLLAGRIWRTSDYGALLRLLEDACAAIVFRGNFAGTSLKHILSTDGYISEGKKHLIVNLIPRDPEMKRLLQEAALLVNRENVFLANKRIVLSAAET